MSDYSKNSFQKAAEAAACVHVNKYMAHETEANLRNLRALLIAEENSPATP